MKNKNLILIAGLIAMTVFWHACNKTEQGTSQPLPGNEPLTTMALYATNANDASDTVSASWVQLDPTGTSNPNLSKDTLHLKHGATYNVIVKVLDTLTDITPEIQARENYHLFCFSVAAGLNLNCLQTDLDTNPKPLPIGLTDKFTVGQASSGTLEVTLHHQPNVKDSSCEPGSIDLDANFTIIIY